MRSKLGKKALLSVAVTFVLFLGILFWLRVQNSEQSSANPNLPHSVTQKIKTAKQSKKTTKSSNLPNVSPSDWELRLVNREHVTPELNPELTTVGTVQVDSRIAQDVSDFLMAAQAIDPAFHLISGYRSVAYQKELFQSYVNQEKASNPNLSDEAAIEIVKTYSQPAGASEHQTGLAIDLSTVDALNQADKAVMAKVHALAPEYGFVLRFPEGKKSSTGVGYEDWHFRYVGKASARYMTDHQLTLEEYVKQLEDNAS